MTGKFSIAGPNAWFLLFALFYLTICGPVLADKRVALVIGNDHYSNLPPDRQLQKAVNDAQAVGDRLARIGFEVIRGSNLSRQAMVDKLAEFTAHLDVGDTAAFFYAGHGVAIGGVNYLVPSDVPQVTEGAEARVRGASISEPDLIAEVQAKSPRVAFLVLDACRDNPFPRTGGRSIGNTRGLAEAKLGRGVFEIYSAGIGQAALDRLEQNDANPNSVFTRVFIDQLAKPGVDLGGLAIEVRERVAELALKAKNDFGQPDPQEQTPAYYDQTIGGRIYLAGVPTTVEAPKARPVEDPAAQAWAVTKETNSQAVLEDFIRQFGDTVFGSMARARLEELRKNQVVVVAPAAAPEKRTGVDVDSPHEQWKRKYHLAVRKGFYQVIIASILSVNHEEALGRLKEFETKFPDVGFEMASTLGPNENRNYAIQIGSGLNKKDAIELRDWAVRNGFPKDTYIYMQSYSAECVSEKSEKGWSYQCE